VKRALENKIAVVTGGSGAIGSAIIADLERQGACAVSLDVARPAAEAAAFQDCDVREDNSVASAIAKVQRTYGALIWSYTRPESPAKRLYGSLRWRTGILCRA